jgi:nitrite reductase/ring-hydroxylating ferredoxin subunit
VSGEAPARISGELIDCGALSEIEDGGMRLVPGPDGEIGLFRRGDEVFALRNLCPHNAAPVCLGDVAGTTVATARATGGYDVEAVRDGEILRCPWHKWEFDLRTGVSVTSPTRRVRAYEVVVEDGRVLVVAKRKPKNEGESRDERGASRANG